MINAAPPTSNSVHGREKCFKYNNFNLPVVQSLRGRGTVVKGQSSLLADLEVASSNYSPAKSLFLNFVHFFLFVFWSFFPFRLFPFILTTDPLKLHKDFAITLFLV